MTTQRTLVVIVEDASELPVLDLEVKATPYGLGSPSTIQVARDLESVIFDTPITGITALETIGGVDRAVARLTLTRSYDTTTAMRYKVELGMTGHVVDIEIPLAEPGDPDVVIPLEVNLATLIDGAPVPSGVTGRLNLWAFVGGPQVPTDALAIQRVTPPEITAGIATGPRLWSPADVASAALQHGAVGNSEFFTTANRPVRLAWRVGDNLFTEADFLAVTVGASAGYTIPAAAFTDVRGYIGVWLGEGPLPLEGVIGGPAGTLARNLWDNPVEEGTSLTVDGDNGRWWTFFASVRMSNIVGETLQFRFASLGEIILYDGSSEGRILSPQTWQYDASTNQNVFLWTQNLHPRTGGFLLFELLYTEYENPPDLARATFDGHITEVTKAWHSHDVVEGTTADPTPTMLTGLSDSADGLMTAPNAIFNRPVAIYIAIRPYLNTDTGESGCIIVQTQGTGSRVLYNVRLFVTLFAG